MTDPELQRRASRRVDVLDRIAELQEELKTFKAEDKSDGYDEKALAKCIKELRQGPEHQAAQLELELVLDTYRRNLGLPTTLEDAQQRVADAAVSVPGADAGERVADRIRRMADSPGLAGTSIQFGDGEPIPLGPDRKARAKRATETVP